MIRRTCMSASLQNVSCDRFWVAATAKVLCPVERSAYETCVSVVEGMAATMTA